MSECQRAYFFHYYGSWGGWESEAPRKVRELYVLKKLHNRHTWAGGMVHSAIRRELLSLRRGRTPEPEQAIERVRNTMREDYAFSRRRAYWQERSRKDFSGLVEHEYGEPVSDEEWRANFETVREALFGFFSSRWVELARSLQREQWLEVDELDFDRSVFLLDEVKVFAVPDFAYLEQDGSPVVVDWKTGRAREGYDDQVLGYALYLSSRYRLPLSRMRAVLVYLNQGQEHTVAIDEGAVAGFRERFGKSVAAMRALLEDPASNVPLAEECFGQTTDASSCARCVFRRPCGKQVALPST
ncbi:MAG: PD-(D/E)XK nuclease family protein [Myxococcales bacterium]|nr:PD-(D/E)XK nuclease family protein [Myxococcales bacterium]